MDVSDYQDFIRQNRNNKPNSLTTNQLEMLNYALALPDEVGEVLGVIKKHIFHKHHLDHDKLLDEIVYLILN